RVKYQILRDSRALFAESSKYQDQKLSSRLKLRRKPANASGLNLLLPALPAIRIRTPFLPPCQLPLQRLTAFLRSAMLQSETALRHSTCSPAHLCDCCNGKSVH